MDRWEKPAVRLLVVLFILVFSIYGVGRHNRYNSSALDLGIQDNVLWNTIQGRPFQCSIETSFYLGDHFTLTIPFYSLLYLIWNDVRLILIVQTLLLAVGAFAISRLASKKSNLPWAGPAAALAFLLYPPLGFIARFDFHPEVAVIPLFLFAIYCFEEKKTRLGYFLTLLVLFSKEQYGLVIGMWGISLMVFERKWQRGLLFCVVGFGWSYLALFHFIPAIRGGSSDTLVRYRHLAETPGQLIGICISDPVRILKALLGSSDRQRYLWQLLWPLAGLCFLSPRIFIIALPVIFYNLLSNNVNQHSLFYQYNAPLIPWLFWSVLQGISGLKQGRGWLFKKWPDRIRLRIAKAGFCLLPLGCLFAFILYNPLTTRILPPHFEVYGWEDLPNVESIREASRLIPAEATLSTTMGLVPHFSHRQGIFLAWGEAYLDRDYLLFNLYDHRWNTPPEDYERWVQDAIGKLGYQAIYFKDGIILLQKQPPGDLNREVEDYLKQEENRLSRDNAVDLEYQPETGHPLVLFRSGKVRNETTQEEWMTYGHENDCVAFHLIERAMIELGRTGKVFTEGQLKDQGYPNLSQSIFTDLEPTPSEKGYYLLDRFGKIYPYGDARFYGDDRDSSEKGSAIDLSITPDGAGYAVLRSFGEITTFGNARLENLTYQPFGWDIARALLLTGKDRGYLLDGFGGIHALGAVQKYRCENYGEPDRMVDLEMDREGNLWLLDREGRIYPALPVKE